ncbi:uncharacterized protein LOC111284844 [Durio zibethinus]|uniref:Uncharacterized protein LOC111284844 n=1 Tax=Durio zibethinus TaxID=66656 RepID=A0A6P5XNY7_DURZI|nr:uncharacterized protein LOC111284844 [Durio zibethinus]
MEDRRNIFEIQVTGISKTKEGKPPTRLQKHAPASLKLDQMKAAAARISPFGPCTGNSEAATPIPLLTPLALSPNPFPGTEEFLFPIDDKEAATPASTPTPTAFGWKQPAGAGYVEASTFMALFQNKCVLVNDAQ